MVEISRDGKRVYWTNSLYSTWDEQFYPDGVPGAMVKADVGANGGLTLDKDFCVEFPAGLPRRTRSGWKAATARPTPSAIPPSDAWTRTRWTTAGLWLAVVASGLYHGVNPGMGWPLAVRPG